MGCMLTLSCVAISLLLGLHCADFSDDFLAIFQYVKMTKLMEWLLGVSLFASIWIALVTRQVHSRLLDEWMFLIKPLPLIVLILFGLYSIAVILWRVYNFNNCEDAAKELQMEIQEAKDDLKKKGFVFDSDR
ncbi:dolichol-phosphate mannosyltransferase subunit 3 isoform X1 [Schistocerca cancellata]|uniref:dolichol-phosphate mannosyltransferase subunit 3 isoform X1 n=2 Tax=Schistocerca cancellata TaxID=274614 RepID=UPI0021199D7D|nr:dolichol-phosphate mannosyltransferase subunit 3 isoform X1 [Schistocerca cancellata]